MIGPNDPGVGHVFQTTTGGATWTDVSGNVPDAPMGDIVYRNGTLVVGSDFGVFTSSNKWLACRKPPGCGAMPSEGIQGDEWTA